MSLENAHEERRRFGISESPNSNAGPTLDLATRYCSPAMARRRDASLTRNFYIVKVVIAVNTESVKLARARHGRGEPGLIV